jgi:hypothetical protein
VVGGPALSGAARLWAAIVVTVTVNDVLDGHVALDVQCLDRIYLNGYVPNLQVGGLVSFMREHLGYPIPITGDHGEDRHRVPPVGDRVRRGRARPGGAVRQGRPQDRRDASVCDGAGPHRSVWCRGDRVAQEFQNVFLASLRDRDSGVP